MAVIATVMLGLAVYGFIRKDTVARGVSVGGVDIGGLGREAAIKRLRERMLPTLRRPVVITEGDRTFRLGPRESRVAADLEGSVDAAITAGRSGFFAVTAVRDIAHLGPDREIEPTVSYSYKAVDRLLNRVRKEAQHPPVDAKLSFSPDGFQLVEAKDGVRINWADLRQKVIAAIMDPSASHRLAPRAHRSKPKVYLRDLADKYPTLLVVNRKKFKLTIYKHLKKLKTYGIAVGRVGLETPVGVYKIQNKAINPAWHVPDSDWAGKLKGKVIPGGAPNNPLKSRWLGIYDGVGIHGTGDPASIGSNASHGCIRMRIPEVEELYDEVPIGTEIYIS